MSLIFTDNSIGSHNCGFSVFLVTVHNPISSNDGDLIVALHGSFLPVPSNDRFRLEDPAAYASTAAPGAVVVRPGRIFINEGRDRVRICVRNRGDRPIQVSPLIVFPYFEINDALEQVGSHYHFIETNLALDFDRGKAYGKRLDIPAGTAVRFEPGDSKTVDLVSIGGAQIITGGNGIATGTFP